MPPEEGAGRMPTSRGRRFPFTGARIGDLESLTGSAALSIWLRLDQAPGLPDLAEMRPSSVRLVQLSELAIQLQINWDRAIAMQAVCDDCEIPD